MLQCLETVFNTSQAAGMNDNISSVIFGIGRHHFGKTDFLKGVLFFPLGIIFYPLKKEPLIPLSGSVFEEEEPESCNHVIM